MDEKRFELLPAGIRSAALRGFVAEQAASPKGPGNENGGGLEWGHVIRPTGAVLRVIHSDDPGDKKGPVLEASFEVRLVLTAGICFFGLIWFGLDYAWFKGGGSVLIGLFWLRLGLARVALVLYLLTVSLGFQGFVLKGGGRGGGGAGYVAYLWCCCS